ncbi:MAG: class I SAM-dependent methyltransferase [Bacteroidetes bacterium]|nr:MAG: class I SAM-dependent methyltransferase [Bacteroidota bacterium]
MKTIWFTTLWATCLLAGCVQPTQHETTEKTTEQRKKEFLEQAKTFGNMAKLKSAIRKIDLTEREVVAFCRENDDMAMRAKMIGAVFSDNEYEEKSATPAYWAAHRYNLSKFVETVTINREGQTTFMDIGSGNGEKLFGALCLGFQKAYGLEYSPQSVQTSKRLLKQFAPEIDIRQGDALTVEASFFQKADFIYMYSPIKDNKLMASLFKRVLENLQEGGVLLEVRFVYGEELNNILPYSLPTVRGWLAIKKEAGKFFYKNIAENAYGYTLIDGRAWQELKAK